MSWNKPSRVIVFSLSVLFIFCICGCISHEIGIVAKRNPAIKFEQYKKYTFVDFIDMKVYVTDTSVVNDFENKDYVIQLMEKKLEDMGFIRDDNEPDFAIWVGYGDKYKKFDDPEPSYDMVPSGTSYEGHPIYTMHRSDHSYEIHIRIMAIIFFDVKDIPRSIKAKELFDMSIIIAEKKIGSFTNEEKKLIFKVLSELSGKKVTTTAMVKKIANALFGKLPLSSSRQAWKGYVIYCDDYDYIEFLPILIDTVLDSYPAEHTEMLVERSLNDMPEWFKESNI